MEDSAVFALFFSCIAGFQYHPGAGTRDHLQLSLDECAREADAMLVLFKERFPCSAR